MLSRDGIEEIGPVVFVKYGRIAKGVLPAAAGSRPGRSHGQVGTLPRFRRPQYLDLVPRAPASRRQGQVDRRHQDAFRRIADAREEHVQPVAPAGERDVPHRARRVRSLPRDPEGCIGQLGERPAHLLLQVEPPAFRHADPAVPPGHDPEIEVGEAGWLGREVNSVAGEGDVAVLPPLAPGGGVEIEDDPLPGLVHMHVRRSDMPDIGAGIAAVERARRVDPPRAREVVRQGKPDIPTVMVGEVKVVASEPSGQPVGRGDQGRPVDIGAVLAGQHRSDHDRIGGEPAGDERRRRPPAVPGQRLSEPRDESHGGMS